MGYICIHDKPYHTPIQDQNMFEDATKFNNALNNQKYTNNRYDMGRGGQSSRKIYLSRSIVTYSKMPFK